MKLKICGMKYQDNIQAVANLQPDYLGFIFYEKSKRNFEDIIPSLPNKIKKVGVFVDADLEEVFEKIEKFDLNAVQLHGNESPEYCQTMSTELVSIAKTENLKQIQVIKVFSVGETFDFSVLKLYENACDYFLFDTKGKEKGGNGVVFDWKLLENYSSEKPYFLSGGIGLNEVDSLKSFLKSKASKYCFALDVNSGFEIEQGLKDVEKLKFFKQNLEID